ncbi:MAG: NmrA family NAD(P)-binding protein [Sneathiella sp.]
MTSNEIYVVTGASGRTGSAAARALLEAGKSVRVVVRDKSKGDIWKKRGAEVAIASLTDTASMENALSGARGAYIVSPQHYASDDLFTQAEIIANTIAEAATKAQLSKIVALSSIGAEKPTGAGWIAMNRILEQYLCQAGLPTTFLRAAYFMQNWEPMVRTAMTQGKLPSFLSPPDRKLPMIATDDVGYIAATILCENGDKSQVVELEGPALYSPNDVAENLTRMLGKTVSVDSIPIADWPEALSGSGMSAPAVAGFTEMTQALNSGHICFTEEVKIDHRTGTIPLETVLSSLVKSL